jgi:hypothetical protein
MDAGVKRNREMIVHAVLEGKLSAEHLTAKELDEIQETVVHSVIEKMMIELESQGKWVLWDHEPMLH